VAAEGVVGLVCAGREGTCTTASLSKLLTTDVGSMNNHVEPTCRASILRGDAVALSRRSAPMAMAKAFFILVTRRKDLEDKSYCCDEKVQLWNQSSTRHIYTYSTPHKCHLPHVYLL
jgi:hypothetical protein